MLGSAKLAVNRDQSYLEEAFDNAVDEYAGHELTKYDKNGSDFENESDWDTDLEDEIQSDRNKFDPTGTRAYIDMCNSLEILPSVRIMEGLKKQTLKLSHGAIRSNEVESLIAALAVNTNVRDLDLQSNNVNAENVRQLRALLQENFYITGLDLSNNKIGNKGARDIGKIMQDTRNLVKLHIGGNAFDDKTSSHLADGIALNESIKILDLSHNQFMSSGGKDLGLALEVNKSITELDLSWNHLRMQGAIEFSKSITWNTSIITLNLSFNGFADIGAKAMGDALSRNNTLESLDLSYNRITDRGAKGLSHGLSKNQCLKKLNLSYNPITYEGGLEILKAAKEAEELVELLLDEIYLDSKAILLIQEILQRRRQLTVTYKGIARDAEYVVPSRNIDGLKEKIFSVIQKYLKDNNLRMLDLFNNWDKDKSLTLTPDEFALGFQKAKIPLSIDMIEVLMSCLDKNNNGEIEYQEFVAVSKLA